MANPDSERALEEMRKNYAQSERSIGGATFAGLEKLVPFKNGKTLTNSARNTYLNCNRKYQYSYVYGLAPRKPSVPFLVGGLFHDELDKMYTDGEFDETAARNRIAKACEKASNYEGLTPDDSDKIWMQQAIAMGAVKGYAKRYLEQDLEKWEVIAAEGDFSVPIGDGWFYKGKTDLIVRERKVNKMLGRRRNLLVEHKTAGRLDAAYVAKLPLDSQILGYAWAKGQEGVKLDGVIYNVTKKPQIRLRQNETMNQFYKRVEEEYILNPVSYFYRETLVFSPQDIKRFAGDLKDFTKDIERSQAANKFSVNTSHCTAMGVCPFMKLCLEGVNKTTLMHYRIKDRPHEELPQEDA
jgi:hypothetical protein